MKQFSLSLFLAVLMLFVGCSRRNSGIPVTAILKKEIRGQVLDFEKPDADLMKRFTSEAKADTVHFKDGSFALATKNREFMDSILLPAVERRRTNLEKLSHRDLISDLALFVFEAYSSLIGPSFYRWGGDLLDLDDPQPRGISVSRRYGLDCSGFTTAAYDLAVESGLMEADEALFSSQGYELFCRKSGFQDRGALDGGSNRYRLDTRELYQLGEEVWRIEEGEKPTADQISRLKAGDIAGRNGHFGIIADLGGELVYLESGGWVVPAVGGRPVKVPAALTKFAKNGYVSVRRCLK